MRIELHTLDFAKETDLRRLFNARSLSLVLDSSLASLRIPNDTSQKVCEREPSPLHHQGFNALAALPGFSGLYN